MLVGQGTRTRIHALGLAGLDPSPPPRGGQRCPSPEKKPWTMGTGEARFAAAAAAMQPTTAEAAGAPRPSPPPPKKRGADRLDWSMILAGQCSIPLALALVRRLPPFPPAIDGVGGWWRKEGPRWAAAASTGAAAGVAAPCASAGGPGAGAALQHGTAHSPQVR